MALIYVIAKMNAFYQDACHLTFYFVGILFGYTYDLYLKIIGFFFQLSCISFFSIKCISILA
uniref:Uncharacterized protein n=1 Tax=Rhizophora mucronata TaxID=61149 RepID=A0A2P2NS67_RHIMU